MRLALGMGRIVWNGNNLQTMMKCFLFVEVEVLGSVLFRCQVEVSCLIE